MQLNVCISGSIWLWNESRRKWIYSHWHTDLAPIYLVAYIWSNMDLWTSLMDVPVWIQCKNKALTVPIKNHNGIYRLKIYMFIMCEKIVAKCSTISPAKGGWTVLSAQCKNREYSIRSAWIPFPFQYFGDLKLNLKKNRKTVMHDWTHPTKNMKKLNWNCLVHFQRFTK